jgi:DNA-binding NtrC family response regulator
MHTLLVIHPNPERRSQLCQHVSKHYRPLEADTLEQAVEQLKQHPVELILCASPQSEQALLDFLKLLHQRNSSICTVLLANPLTSTQYREIINLQLVHSILPLDATPDLINQHLEQALAQRTKTRSSAPDPAQAAPLHLPHWSHRLKQTAEASMRSSGTILSTLISITLITALVAMGVGILILLILYFTKTLLGIDLLENLHLFSRH